MNNSQKAKILLAQYKGKEIEVLSRDGLWISCKGDTFDFDNYEYRVKKISILKPILEKAKPILKKANPILEKLFIVIEDIRYALSTKRTKEIQAGIMLGIIIAIILYTMVYEASNNIAFFGESK